MAQDITIMGASYEDVPAVTLPKTGGGTAQFTDVTDTTATASDVASGKQFFDALGVLTQGTASGGGGASNIVTGTFKGTTTEQAMDINLNYSGSGYPVAVVIYPKEGSYNSSGTYYNLIQKNAIKEYNVVKNYPESPPDYINDAQNNYASCMGRTKSSTSSATSYSYLTLSNNGLIYKDESASRSSSAYVRLRSNKKLSVYILGSSGYGFAANIDYTYHVIYSS